MAGATASHSRPDHWAWPSVSSPTSGAQHQHQHQREHEQDHQGHRQQQSSSRNDPKRATTTSPPSYYFRDPHHLSHTPSNVGVGIAQPINFNFYHIQSPFEDHPGMETATLEHHGQVDAWLPHYSAPAPVVRSPSHASQHYNNFVGAQRMPSQHHSLNAVAHNPDYTIPWEISTMPPPPVDIPLVHHADHHDGFISDRNEPRDSVSSAAFSTPQTATSSMSDGWVFPVSSPSRESPGALARREAVEVEQPAVEHVARITTFEHTFVPYTKAVSPISSDGLSFEEGAQIDWNLIDTYGTETVHWSPPQQMPHTHVEVVSVPAPAPTSLHHEAYAPVPWASHEVQAYVDHMQSSCIAYQPSQQPPQSQQAHPVSPYRAKNLQDEMIPVTKIKTTPGKGRSARKAKEVEWEEIAQQATYATSYSSHSRSPPTGQRTPSQTSSPSHSSPSPQSATGHHSHVFSAFPGPQKRKAQRGRVRPLTSQEKRNAREVRLAGACWACHLSKIRCSPCSPGAPCEQCTRLSGKRRFCLLPCFNDPLEALNTFLVPDYLMGHFTRANVENFVNRNATSWGSEPIVVQMSWGFQRPLKATVVPLTSIGAASEIGYRHRAISNGTAKPTLSRHESPPLGVKLEEMLDMEAEYAAYVKDIVMNDLDYYAEEAYADEESELPELILKAVCDFYTAGLEAEDECDLLRQAIEIHVTCTILERSLILDEQSLAVVEQTLGERYPAKSVPRCAQRQIKLALYNQQRQRIVSVLAKWGSLMWTSNSGTTNERKWATGFSVFLMLTLITDKTLGAAYLFCESRIKNHGFDEEVERSKFEQLGRLTETELFERCKEILHSRFKTRKAGKESCNPIRDGSGAWKGRPVDARTERFVRELQGIVAEFSEEVRSHRSAVPEDPADDCQYLDAGRLACILLDDFLDH